MKEGFFGDEEFATSKPVRKRLAGCGACGLHKKCRSPRMEVSGKGQLGILIVAEAPGEMEDRKGVQLVGQVGQYFRRILSSMDIDLDRDCWKINSVNCRPTDKKGSNRPPTNAEVEFCRPNVWKVIETKKPKMIWLMGKHALDSFLGHRWGRKIGSIGDWRGWVIPDRDVKAWVCPMYHPSFPSNYDSGVGELIFEKDIRRALKHLNRPLPKWEDEKKYVHMSTDANKINHFLDLLLERKPIISIDYETTGLKPQKKGHRILSCAIATSPKYAVAFPLIPEIIPKLKEVLQDPKIKKIGASIKFEMNWSRVILKARIRGFLLDTLLSTHIRDNRSGITSVKLQTYVQFGVIDYEAGVEEYKKATDNQNGNAFNRMDELKLRTLLVYNGLDALYEYRIGWNDLKWLKKAK